MTTESINKSILKQSSSVRRQIILERRIGMQKRRKNKKESKCVGKSKWILVIQKNYYYSK